MSSSRAGAGVAPQEREQVVAEVESRVTDTGEGLVDAFGPPGVYAAQSAEGPARLDGNATRPGDGIPGWLTVVILLLAVMFAPYAFVLVLAPFVVAAGGAAYAGAGGSSCRSCCRWRWRV